MKIAYLILTSKYKFEIIVVNFILIQNSIKYAQSLIISVREQHNKIINKQKPICTGQFQCCYDAQRCQPLSLLYTI